MNVFCYIAGSSIYSVLKVDQHIYKILRGEYQKADAAPGQRPVGRPPRKQAKTNVPPPLPKAIEEAKGLAAAIHALHKAYGNSQSCREHANGVMQIQRSSEKVSLFGQEAIKKADLSQEGNSCQQNLAKRICIQGLDLLTQGVSIS